MRRRALSRDATAGPLVAQAEHGRRMRRIQPLVGIAYDPGRRGSSDLAARRV